jgi:hypothetical protein
MSAAQLTALSLYTTIGSGHRTMKRKGKLIILGFFILVCGGAALFFTLRSPVLVLSDEPFVLLYGKQRILIQRLYASISMGRRVSQVIVSDTAGTDLVVLAIEEAVSRPWCVVFPYRYEDAARRYHEQYPEIPVVLLSGQGMNTRQPDDEGLFFEFSNDAMLDFYRIGQFAAILCRDTPGKIPVFIPNAYPTDSKNAFLQGFNRIECESEPYFFTSYSQLPANEVFPAAVISPRTDFQEKKSGVPLILFTWLDPALTSPDTIIVMDDSAWAQLPAALKMVKERRKSGEIPSKPLIISAKITDNGILRQLKMAGRALPESGSDESQIE